jgi:NADH-quinone oxidoreductase subunit M
MENVIMNQLDYSILSWTVFLPLLGIPILMLIRNASAIRWTTLLMTIVTFFVSLPLLCDFDKTTHKMQFVEKSDWIPSWGISYFIGIDGISVLFIFLTTLLSILCVLVSWKSVQTKVKEFHIAILAMETGMLGVFVAMDFFLFYLFWEAMLIPMFILIGVDTDVHSDRRLRWIEQGICGGQVFPLHINRKSPDACWYRRPLSLWRQDTRYPGA